MVRHWPNPAGDKIFLELSSDEKTVVSYQILNFAGAVVAKSEVKLTAGSQTILLPVSQLRSGIYYLQLTGESLKQPVSFAFVKQ